MLTHTMRTRVVDQVDQVIAIGAELAAIKKANAEAAESQLLRDARERELLAQVRAIGAAKQHAEHEATVEDIEEEGRDADREEDAVDDADGGNESGPARRTLKDQVILFMAGVAKPLHKAEIARGTGLKERQVTFRLIDLKRKDGFAETTGKGVWQLTDSGMNEARRIQGRDDAGKGSTM